MSRRNLIKKFVVWNNYNSSGAAAPSTNTTVDQVDDIKYIIQVDPSVDGSIEVEFADDKNVNDEVWLPLDFKRPLLIDGATETDYEILIEKAVSLKLRLSFTNNGGTGNIDAWVTGANIGA